MAILLRKRVCPFGGRGRGFTLLELMTATLVLAILAALAIPGYRKILTDQKVKTAIADIGHISLRLKTFELGHSRLPQTLAELSNEPFTDPWDAPYEYLNFDDPAPGIKARARKDHNLHPINSDFDLYSKGPDGGSNAPLTAHASRDDIIRARDGRFVGVAEDY